MPDNSSRPDAAVAPTTVSSDDGLVTAVVDAAGRLVELRLEPAAIRKDSADLAELVRVTVDTALDAARTALIARDAATAPRLPEQQESGVTHLPTGAVVSSDGRDGIVYRLGDRQWTTAVERDRRIVAVWAGPASHWDDGTVLTSAELATALEVVVAVLHRDGYRDVDIVWPDRQERR